MSKKHFQGLKDRVPIGLYTHLLPYFSQENERDPLCHSPFCHDFGMM